MQSVGSSPSCDTCVFEQDTPCDSSFGWDVKSLVRVLCNARKRTQCIFRKDKGFARLTAYCATALCKPRCYVKGQVSLVFQNVLPHPCRKILNVKAPSASLSDRYALKYEATIFQGPDSTYDDAAIQPQPPNWTRPQKEFAFLQKPSIWLKTLYTIGNCHRPVFSISVSQHIGTTNL